MPPCRRRVLISVLSCAIAMGACRSASPEPDPAAQPRPYVPLPDEPPQSVGYFLTVFDDSLATWSELKLASSSSREERTLEALERSMAKRAKERQEELLHEFDSGPPVNRRIAAAALGFTGDPAVLGTLLRGLSDTDEEVIQKSLLGIGVLGQADTPLGDIRKRLEQDPNSWTRINAAFALLCIAGAGNRSLELAESCRLGCADSEAGVRAQCASALGVVVDEGGVSALSRLLHDESNLAALAAVASLARIGKTYPQLKGTVARTLALALEDAEAERREHILGSLTWVSDQNLGTEPGPWLEWAQKLP